jgi:hypothetical protein
MNDWESSLSVRVFNVEPVLSRQTTSVERRVPFYCKVPIKVRGAYNAICAPVFLVQALISFWRKK